MVKDVSGKVRSYSAGEEILSIYGTQNDYYPAHTNLPSPLILSQINQFHPLTAYIQDPC
jgi:hypothetical protein